jgi:hypothetical protein
MRTKHADVLKDRVTILVAVAAASVVASLLVKLEQLTGCICCQLYLHSL